MPASEWTIVPYQGEEGLRQLETEWLRLYEELPFRAAYHTFASTAVYLRHLSPTPETFTCFALSDGVRVRAICPLERTKQWLLGMHVSTWSLPYHLQWIITDAICPDGEARAQLVPRLVDHLRAGSDSPSLLVLGPAPEYSALLEGLAALPGSRYCRHLAWRSHVNDCRQPFEQITASLQKNTRARIRKAHRRLAEHEDVRFVTASTPAELERELDAFLAVEASGWKGPSGSGTAILCNPELVTLYRDMALTLGAVGACEINTLYADGRCIAGEFCVVGREEYARVKIGYDEEYVSIIPGKLLFEDTLRRCCEDERVVRLNALTEVMWLPSWGATTVPVEQAHVAITAIRGRLVVALFRFQWFARELLHSYRAWRARSKPASGPKSRSEDPTSA